MLYIVYCLKVKEKIRIKELASLNAQIEFNPQMVHQNKNQFSLNQENFQNYSPLLQLKRPKLNINGLQQSELRKFNQIDSDFNEGTCDSSQKIIEEDDENIERNMEVLYTEDFQQSMEENECDEDAFIQFQVDHRKFDQLRIAKSKWILEKTNFNQKID
ncbi:UNKNOWN [Stylonychia lemnae]|uniref:Uncharacterized protein n=1 Tax=Stylonychia lemnae TaxID=5949 RepID=A0A078AKG6_STYLE|nr:UNKNOWN [Stylonychia lemnae]|eukprot:CDW81318.1 UNKNOWN [Stylonychia lemnae]